MNVPSLQRLTLLSLIFHITFFGMTFVVIKQSTRFVMPSPYVVNLVESDFKPESTGGTEMVSKTPAPEVLKPVQKKEEMTTPSTKESGKASKKDERQLEEKIAAMKAKKDIARLAKLRSEMNKIVQLKAGKDSGRTGPSNSAAGGRRDGVSDDYYAKIHQQIWNRWGVPREMKEKKLEAIVSIRIRRDGNVEIMGMEKPSGSSVFDRSALAAIKDASPLPAPPYEMEIGVRFYP